MKLNLSISPIKALWMHQFQNFAPTLVFIILNFIMIAILVAQSFERPSSKPFSQSIHDPLSYSVVKCADLVSKDERCTDFGYYVDNPKLQFIVDELKEQMNITKMKQYSSRNQLYNEKPLFGIFFTVNNLTNPLTELEIHIAMNQKIQNTEAMCKFDAIGLETYTKFKNKKICTSNNQLLILQTHIEHIFAKHFGVYYHPLFKLNPFVQPVELQQKTSLILCSFFILQFAFAFIEFYNDKKSGFLLKYRILGNADITYFSFKFSYCALVYFILQIINMLCFYGGDLTQISMIDSGEMLVLVLLVGVYSTSFAMLIGACGTLKMQFLFFCFTLGGILLEISVTEANGEFQAAFNPVGCWFEYILAPFSMLVALTYFFVNQNKLSFELDPLTGKFTLQKIKQFGFSKIFQQVEDQDQKHAPLIILIVLVLVLAIVQFVVAYFMELKLKYFGSTGEWQKNDKKYLATMGDVQQEKTTRKLKENETRVLLDEEQVEKCELEADIVQPEVLTTKLSKSHFALICHHLHVTNKTSTDFDQPQQPMTDFSCAVREGQTILVTNYPFLLKSLIGEIPLDKPGFQLFSNSKKDKDAVNQFWSYGHKCRDNNLLFRLRTSYLSLQNFSSNYPDLTVHKYLKMMAQLQKVAQFDQNAVIQDSLAIIQMVDKINVKICKLNQDEQYLITYVSLMLNYSTQVLLIDDIWKAFSPQIQIKLVKIIEHFKLKCGKVPLAYGTADNIRIKRIQTKQLSIVIQGQLPENINITTDQIITKPLIDEPKISMLNSEVEEQQQNKIKTPWQQILWKCIGFCLLLALIMATISQTLPVQKNKIVDANTTKIVSQIIAASDQIGNRECLFSDQWNRLTSCHLNIGNNGVDRSNYLLHINLDRYYNQFAGSKVHVFDKTLQFGRLQTEKYPNQPSFINHNKKYSFQYQNDSISFISNEFTKQNGFIDDKKSEQLYQVSNWLPTASTIEYTPSTNFTQNRQIIPSGNYNLNEFEVMLVDGRRLYNSVNILENYWKSLFMKKPSAIKIDSNNDQQLQKVLANLTRSIPAGYIDFDNEKSQKLKQEAESSKLYKKVLCPLISSFPGVYMNDNPMFSGYQQEVEFIPQFEYINRTFGNKKKTDQIVQSFKKLLKLKQNVSIASAKIPSILGLTDFELTQPIYLSPLHDLSTRMFSSVINTSTVRFQVFRFEPFNHFTINNENQKQIFILVTIFLSLAILFIQIEQNMFFVREMKKKDIKMLFYNIFWTFCQVFTFVAFLVLFSQVFCTFELKIVLNLIFGVSLLETALIIFIECTSKMVFVAFLVLLILSQFNDDLVNAILPLNVIYETMESRHNAIWIQVIVWAIIDLFIMFKRFIYIQKKVKYDTLAEALVVNDIESINVE